MPRPYRKRRSCLAVPGSSEKMIKKAQTLDADQIFLDLEDSVAPSAKPGARGNIVAALRDGDWTGKTKVVRINDADTRWAYDDVIDIVVGAGAHLDCIMLPKVEKIAHIHWLNTLLNQLELSLDLPVGTIGIEAQIEGPGGLSDIEAIATSTPRLETIIFGPGDFSAAMHMPQLTIGEAFDNGHNPFDHVFMAIAVAARKHGLQAIDGPFAKIYDIDGYRTYSHRAAAYGFDGKWVLHPGQIATANEVFSPPQEAYDKAELILEAYAYYTSDAGGGLGAVMLGDEMIDEASAKIALSMAERGRRLSMNRTTSFTRPVG
ncbi:HpcH/HpaI aldolase/citrate lyase family protein [Rhodococcoides yunnanense]|uniref:HpcH/HpaI aldolase/citrate lyase family protein n=1 Tax=Rhodococcoides yunnanense TaxID=278209 RepID=UPI000932C552|nr:CoA ester lyase [Rhodococcus yunnanensis]